MPPRPPRARSPRPSLTPPKDLPLPSTLICKSESHTSFRAVVETSKEELCSVLGSRKSPPPRSKSPKGKERDQRPSGSPKEGQKTISRPGSPKDKLGEGDAVLDLVSHRLSWADTVPESPKPSTSMKPPSPVCLPFLGSLEAHEPTTPARPPLSEASVTGQTQLELSCIVAAQMQLHQDKCTLAPAPPQLQRLGQEIVGSLDKDRAMRDLCLSLAKSPQEGRCVEYPVCLLCARCNPSCAHPRRRHGPSLLVYPQQSVQDGELHIGLGFLLKMKKAEAAEWGQEQELDATQAQPKGKGRPPPAARPRPRSAPPVPPAAPASRPRSPAPRGGPATAAPTPRPARAAPPRPRPPPATGATPPWCRGGRRRSSRSR
uniref:Uncharacterized protein n=1 Tax=Salvator merianae TaxID=96440 RepID=A0A8D0DN34_SALMN